MKPFIGRDFLLNTDTARRLYEEHADMKRIPILDYHCHINPQEIYEDRQFENIAQVWLAGDHYKWRQMRANGVEERYITGDAPDRAKFQKWAETLPKLIGNPLYHWSHLELRYYFGYEGNLNSETSQEVWDLCREKLASPGFSVRNLIRRSNVRLICTTDDPADTLEWHKKLRADASFDVQVLPAMRPDKAVNIEKQEFPAYLERLSVAAGVTISDLDSLHQAIRRRMDAFGENGCRLSDHGLEFMMYRPASEEEVGRIFKKRLAGGALTHEECLQYKTHLLLFLAGEYHARGWVMQIHYGCRRDNNTRMYRIVGVDTGFDCIGDETPASEISGFLNDLSFLGRLPKMIFYSLNPNDDTMLGTILGCFQDGGIKGRLQQGSAWWYNDHYTGMVNQMKAFASQSCFGNFVGMLTDSRSFLSYTRHDYFRRILCDLIGGWVENGEYPDDEKVLEKLIRGICYNNAVEYFGFEVEEV